MLAGDLYIGDDPELAADSRRAYLLAREYEATYMLDATKAQSILAELVGVLGAPVSSIFGELEVFERPTEPDDAAVSEPIPGVLVVAEGAAALAHLGQGVTYRRLTPTALPGVELFESTYPPGSSSSVDGAMLVHEGFESGHVVSGTLTFEFSEGEVRLGPGGSLSFLATRPHRVVNETSEPASAVWLTLPGGLPQA